MTSTMDFPAQRDDERLTDTAAAPGEAVEAPQDADEPTELPDTGSADETLTEQELQARRAEREAEYDRILHLDPDDVVIDENVRTENIDTDPDTVRDMRNRGVDTAVRGYRADDGTVMITCGQRRVLHARKAGCTVPVWMQAPPSEDERKATIERVVRQINENDLRVPLTRGDKYRGVKQLAAFDLTPTGIARKLGRGKGGKEHIENVLKVGESELAARAADRFSLTLDQAAVIADFEGYGDHATAKELIRIAKVEPNNFAVYAEHKRREHAESEQVRQLTEQLTAELTEAGLVILDDTISDLSGPARSLDRLRPSPESEPHTPLTADEHASCSGRAAWIEQDHDEDGKPTVTAVYGCSDFIEHGHALAHAAPGRADFSTDATSADGTDNAAAEAEEDAAEDAAAKHTAALEAHMAQERERLAASIRRKWVIDNNKLWDASTTPRREWLAGFAQRKKAPTGAAQFLAVQKAQGTHELRRAMERNHPLAHKLLKLPEPGMGQPNQLPGRISAASAAQATLFDVFLTLCAIEDSLSRNAWRTPYGVERDYMATIIGWGYRASDVERKVINPEREQDVVAAKLGAAGAGTPDRDDTRTSDSENDPDADGPGIDDDSGEVDEEDPADLGTEDVQSAEADTEHAPDAHGGGIDDAEFSASEGGDADPSGNSTEGAELLSATA
ncbi:hypothetical protein L3Q67_01685 [Saccharothrix sp. AJ9571]|nr:hypothetical protein L3Q67_01685 [Saccharothrix sp. AJ9571]